MSEDTSGRSGIGDSPNDVTVGEPGLVRIGELSRRVGISDHTLRAWETRYGLLRPHRSSGGFRLYSADDERRVRRMSHLLGRGLSPA
ncbi:MAG: MerR family transcriptional regulator, partial [Candidatus Phosphoribacter baldrii]